MPPKSSNTGKEKKLVTEDEDEVLQAIILADSFNKRFKPLTIQRPRCLLPVCNAPLLEWTFESLALAGVQEAFVVCRSHTQLIKEAIRDSKWSKPNSGLKIMPIMLAKETFSVGDAMRDIYTRGLVTSDFVLVMGDLVSNVKIDQVVRAHKDRRKTNKDAIMTIVVKESGVRHRTRSRGDSSVFVLDPHTSECLHYEPVAGYPPKGSVQIPRGILEAHPEIEIRNDLIDCSIDICSPEVPSLFQDNFDYLDIRRDFVHGILTSDLLMKNIFCYVVNEGYAARVQDTKSYDSVSKDILSRWTFPLVPDSNHPGRSAYEHQRGNKYIPKDSTVILSRTCEVGNNTLIGPSTMVSDNARIIASVIGKNCVIGAGSIICNSYILDGTTIGSDCVVQRSIIGSGVWIKDKSTVDRGCLISDGVVIGPGTVLNPFERLSVKASNLANVEEGENDSDLEEAETNQNLVSVSLGPDSNAIVWPRDAVENEDEDDADGPENAKNQRFLRIGDDVSDIESLDHESSSCGYKSETSDDDDDHPLTQPDSRSLSSNAGLPQAPTIPTDVEAENEFKNEVRQSLERAFSEGHSVDNAAVELKTLRMASNVPLSRVREAVIAAIVERIRIIPRDPSAQRQEIASVVGRWGPLINKIGGVDAVETVAALQIHCVSSERLLLFGQILAALYQADIVEEEDIRAWHVRPSSRGEGMNSGLQVENAQKAWAVGQRMIQQFDEQDSDSEDEDSE